MNKNWLHLSASSVLAGFLLLASSAHTQAQAIKWTTKAAIPASSTGGSNAMCFTIGSKVYVGGGYIAPFFNSKEFYVYDTLTNVWTKKADLPGPLNRSAGVGFAINGKGYIGLGAENFLDISGGAVLMNDLWEYDTMANTWTARAALPDTGRTYASCFVLNNKAYVLGGQVSGGLSTADLWEYDPSGNVWTARAAYPLGPIQGGFAFTLSTTSGSRGYISCGSISTGNTKKTYEYNATANSWAPKSDYPGSAIRSGTTFVINNKAYCGMGLMDFFNYTDTFYAYNPTSGNWSAAITTFPGDPCAYPVAASMGNKAFMGAGWKYAGGGAEVFNSNWYRVIDTAAVTAIDDVTISGSFSLFPNPAVNELNIILTNDNNLTGELAITDLAGRLQFTKAWQQGAPVNITALAAGKYIARLATASGTYYSRFVVLHKQ